MCTLVLMRRPGSAWPLLVAANRDELSSRPARPPGRHWPDRADVVAGLDLQAGGSWLGINDHGVVAGVLNRVGTLGPAAGKRSRGELVLEALDHADAAAAAAALADLDPDAYRPFNLIVADVRAAFWLRHAGALPGFGFRTTSGAWREVQPHQVPGAVLGRTTRAAAIECHAVPAGVSMITAHDLNDESSPRVRHYLPRFRSAPRARPRTRRLGGVDRAARRAREPRRRPARRHDRGHRRRLRYGQQLPDRGPRPGHAGHEVRRRPPGRGAVRAGGVAAARPRSLMDRRHARSSRVRSRQPRPGTVSTAERRQHDPAYAKR